MFLENVRQAEILVMSNAICAMDQEELKIGEIKNNV